MNIISRLFGRKSYKWKKLKDEDDPLMELVINAAFKTGKPQLGVRNDDGSISFNNEKFDNVEDAKRNI